MGRQARLKRFRRTIKTIRQQNSDVSAANSGESEQFVKQLQRQGYNLQQSQRSPELPDDNPEPQL